MNLGRQRAQLVGDSRAAPENGDEVQSRASKYSLGIQMGVVDEKSLLTVLAQLLGSGAPIDFLIRRKEKELRILVRPLDMP